MLIFYLISFAIENIMIDVVEVNLLKFMSANEAALKWGISKRRVQILCSENRINGAHRVGNMWIIPIDAEKPTDARKKNNKN